MNSLRKILSPRSSGNEDARSQSADPEEQPLSPRPPTTPTSGHSQRTSMERRPSSFQSSSNNSQRQYNSSQSSSRTNPQSPRPSNSNNDASSSESSSPRFHWRLEHVLAMAATLLLIIQFSSIQHVPHWTEHEPNDFGQAGEHLQLELQQRHAKSSKPRCAINFWGLPRAFESLVLPSIEKNIIQVNAKYNCDYFMHFFVLEQEEAGRSGQGGHINPLEVYKLRPRVKLIHQTQTIASDNERKPIVEFASTKDQDFWTEYQELLTKTHDTVDDKGKHLYYPDNALTYTFPTTTDNIIKMWHTIQEAWRLMERHERRQGIVYDRVAMFRNDVLYATPIDIYQVNAKSNVMDVHNNMAVVPGFGRHPVSDRLVYGPRKAVEVWAAQRFGRLEQHVQWIQQHDPGWGLHSERFVNYTLFSAMRDQGVHVVEHDTICFFRARSDSSVWVSDCDGSPTVTLPSIRTNLEHAAPSKRALVEQILGRKCGAVTKRTRPLAEILMCTPPAPTTKDAAAAAAAQSKRL